MIKIEDQRELALKILSFSKSKFNLFVEFDKFFEDPDDAADIASFLDPYRVKHDINYFNIDYIDGGCLISNPHLPQLLKLILSDIPKALRGYPH